MDQSDNEQRALWNGPAGQAWVAAQQTLDRVLGPLERPLVEAVAEGSSARVLDVGCGTGSTSVAVARRLAPTGRCVGIDISRPMLEAARLRATQQRVAARFIEADAQSHSFVAGSFDTIISRFGVMFFSDPVAAFANLRSALDERGLLHFVAWRSAAENPFMTTAERAAAPLLPTLPVRSPEGPGQFAFADERKLSALLTDAGWVDVVIRPLDAECSFPATELEGYFTRLGPLALALGRVDDVVRSRVITAVRAAFEPYVEGAEVRFVAACWEVRARPRRGA